jgi:hypothetical protein
MGQSRRRVVEIVETQLRSFRLRVDNKLAISNIRPQRSQAVGRTAHNCEELANMKSSVRLVEPESYTYVAANDNEQRSHRAPVMARAMAGKLFPSPAENLLAIRTINRMDLLLSAAESDVTYATIDNGYLSTEPEDGDNRATGPAIVEVAGRSAEKVLEDFANGPVICYPHPTFEPKFDAPLHIHGRFKFNEDGIVTGYRLNREKRSSDARDAWVSTSSPKHPDNVATARDANVRDPRGIQPGKTMAADIVTPANDDFDARSCVAWIKDRMAPEHFEAVYDVTAGQGFNAIGVQGGFAGKQADAVGKDRVLSGLRQAARLLAKWDDAQ